MPTPRDHLYIGDPHARPGISNRRFDWLGSYIVESRPAVVVDLGDWTDYPSLSSYDGSALTGGGRPKTSFEGRRYKADTDAGVEARDRVHTKLQRAGRTRPRRISLGGNHDHDRISRALQFIPELNGTIGIADQRHAEYGWEFVPFLEPIIIDGIVAQHYFTSGLMGRPTGGADPATRILGTQFCSAVAGHNHLFDQAHRVTADKRKVWCFTAGCFLDPEQRESYAGPANDLWDRGLLRLRNVQYGVPSSIEWIGIDDLRRTYG